MRLTSARLVRKLCTVVLEEEGDSERDRLSHAPPGDSHGIWHVQNLTHQNDALNRRGLGPALGTVGIIGVGEIASAIVDGLRGTEDDSPEIFLSPRNASIGSELADRHPGVHRCTDNQEVVDNASVLILAVRPADALEVLSSLRIPLDRLLISAAAGVSHEQFASVLGEEVPVVRVIPLPAVRQQRGTTAVYPSEPRTEALFGRLGGVLAVSDAGMLAAIQTATATISSHFRYLSSIAAWLADRGVGQSEAEQYIRSMFLGVAGGLADQNRTLIELEIAHETPEGINQQLRRTWFSDDNYEALVRALDEVHARLKDAPNQ